MSDKLFGFGNANTKGLFKCKGCEDLKKYIDEQHSHMDELTKIYDELIDKINKHVEEKRKLKEEFGGVMNTETFKEYFEKNVVIDFDYSVGMFNKVWLNKVWDYQQTKLDQKDARIKELEKENKLLRNNSNCKYGGGNVCTYHNAEYTNCFSACNQWELDNRYKSDFRDIKLSIRGE